MSEERMLRLTYQQWKLLRGTGMGVMIPAWRYLELAPRPEKKIRDFYESLARGQSQSMRECEYREGRQSAVRYCFPYLSEEKKVK